MTDTTTVTAIAVLLLVGSLKFGGASLETEGEGLSTGEAVGVEELAGVGAVVAVVEPLNVGGRVCCVGGIVVVTSASGTSD